MLLIFKFFSAGVILNERLLNYILCVHLVLADVKSRRVEAVLVKLDQLLNRLSHENSFCRSPGRCGKCALVEERFFMFSFRYLH